MKKPKPKHDKKYTMQITEFEPYQYFWECKKCKKKGVDIGLKIENDYCDK
jgi:hypothetical protein